MASLVWSPPQAAETAEVRVGDIIYTFVPGVPQHVPSEHAAAVEEALETATGTLTTGPTPTVAPVSALATPAAPAVIPTAGAAGAQSYYVVATDANGDSLPGAATAIANGPTTLDAGHYNTVTPVAVAGATGYKIIRSAGGPDQGVISTQATAAAFVDNGVASSAYVSPWSGSYSYEVVPYDADHDAVPSAAGSTSTGYSTLIAARSNQVSWAAVTTPGLTGYKVLRTAGGATQGRIGTVAAGTTTLNDTGLAGVAYTPAATPPGTSSVTPGPTEI